MIILEGQTFCLLCWFSRFLTLPTAFKYPSLLCSFENNPRLEGPELQGLAMYDTNCWKVSTKQDALWWHDTFENSSSHILDLPFSMMNVIYLCLWPPPFKTELSYAYVDRCIKDDSLFSIKVGLCFRSLGINYLRS